jgi:hypothetical protein
MPHEYRRDGRPPAGPVARDGPARPFREIGIYCGGIRPGAFVQPVKRKQYNRLFPEGF